MSRQGQTYLMQEIRKAVEYCSREYEMTWSEAIGCLTMATHYYANVAFSMDLTDEEIDEMDRLNGMEDGDSVDDII